MTTGKTIVLTIQTFVDKVMSLLFNMLSRLVIAFLPRNKRLLISWLQSPSTVFGAQENKKSVTISIVSLYICPSDETGCHDLSFLNVESQASFFTLLTFIKSSLIPLPYPGHCAQVLTELLKC